MKKTLISLIIISALAACGGSETPGNIITGEADFIALAASASDAFDEYDVLEPTDFAAVADDGGTASYSGFSLVTEGTYRRNGDGRIDGEIIGYAAAGTLTVEVDFSDTSSATATATNFYEILNVENVDVENYNFADLTTSGSIDGLFEFDLDILELEGLRDEAILSGTVTGDLTKADLSTLELAGAPASGRFLGENLDALSVGGRENTETIFTKIQAFGLRDPETP